MGLTFTKIQSRDLNGIFAIKIHGTSICKFLRQMDIPLDWWLLRRQKPFPSTSHGVILINLPNSSLYIMEWFSRHNLGSAGTGDGMLTFFGSRSSAALCLLMSFVDQLGCQNVPVLRSAWGAKENRISWVCYVPPTPKYSMQHHVLWVYCFPCNELA